MNYYLGMPKITFKYSPLHNLIAMTTQKLQFEHDYIVVNDVTLAGGCATVEVVKNNDVIIKVFVDDNDIDVVIELKDQECCFVTEI